MRSLVLRAVRVALGSAVLRAPVTGVILGAAGALGLGGCKDLTSVDAPNVIQPEDYGTPAGATALAAGAITQFHIVFDDQVRVTGLIADELMVTYPVGVTGDDPSWDSRASQDPSPNTVPYTELHTARHRLLTAIGSFQRVAPDSSERIGQLFALLGYTSVFFGENFCAGVPLGHRDADLRPVYGQPLPTPQLFDSALAAFDSALVYGAEIPRIVDLARVGRGRALLNLGRFSDAAAAAVAVPTEYVYDVTYLNEFGFDNSLAFAGPFGNPSNSLTVPDQEGTNGLNWRTADDSRVPILNRSPDVIGEDGVSEVWGFTVYQWPDSPIPLATGLEARLIEAEAALQAGDASTWLMFHNTLRATMSLVPLADPGSAEARMDLHFRERAFWLFLTGHRHGDLRRLVRQYGRGAESVFPTGAWREGVAYGSATNMAPPVSQLNNPHYTGCLSREP